MMRRPRTLATGLAVLALTLTPSASADTGDPADRRGCHDPHVEWDYDTGTFAAWATLEASGCPAREQRQWALWLSVTRYEATSAHGVSNGVLCGPFLSESQSNGRRYSCDVDLTFDHPEVEEADYQVEVTYPADHGDETMVVDLSCVADDHGTYACSSTSETP